MYNILLLLKLINIVNKIEKIKICALCMKKTSWFKLYFKKIPKANDN